MNSISESGGIKNTSEVISGDGVFQNKMDIKCLVVGLGWKSDTAIE